MRSTLAALFVCVCVAVGVFAAAQQPPPQPAPQVPTTETPTPQTPTPQTPTTQTPATETVAPAPARAFTGDAGLIFFPVKPDKTADFEKIMAKLKEALTASDDPVRRQQAAGWKVFKAVEPGPNNTVLYVFVVDPAVKATDYAFWKMMYDAFPAEAQQLYRLYTAASAGGQTLLNLQLLQQFRPPQP
jgi:hypothetical protein